MVELDGRKWLTSAETARATGNTKGAAENARKTGQVPPDMTRMEDGRRYYDADYIARVAARPRSSAGRWRDE